jgi:hypothetical protein
MTMDATRHDAESTTLPTTAGEMLQEVYRQLVGIHAAIAERTNSDPEIIPWTERELRLLVREISAFRRKHPEAPDAG